MGDSLQPDPAVPVRISFGDHKRRLLGLIRHYPAMVGCVSWFTDYDVLDALKDRWCNFIVNHEEWYAERTTLGKYRELGRNPETTIFPELPANAPADFLRSSMSSRFRSVGTASGTPGKSKPKMHHKFVVFCYPRSVRCVDGRLVDDPDGQLRILDRRCAAGVFTGSYNVTCNAEASLETSLFIESPAVAQCFYDEYMRVLTISAPVVEPPSFPLVDQNDPTDPQV